MFPRARIIQVRKAGIVWIAFFSFGLQNYKKYFNYASICANLCKLEVDLRAIYVCADHFDAHFVAQGVGKMVLGADEPVVLFIVLPSLAREADLGDMNETFTAIFVELNEQTEFGYTGYMSGENLAYMVGQPEGLEQFDGVSFSLCGFLFAGGTMLAH